MGLRGGEIEAPQLELGAGLERRVGELGLGFEPREQGLGPRVGPGVAQRERELEPLARRAAAQQARIAVEQREQGLGLAGGHAGALEQAQVRDQPGLRADLRELLGRERAAFEREQQPPAQPLGPDPGLGGEPQQLRRVLGRVGLHPGRGEDQAALEQPREARRGLGLELLAGREGLVERRDRKPELAEAAAAARLELLMQRAQIREGVVAPADAREREPTDPRAHADVPRIPGVMLERRAQLAGGGDPADCVGVERGEPTIDRGAQACAQLRGVRVVAIDLGVDPRDPRSLPLGDHDHAGAAAVGHGVVELDAGARDCDAGRLQPAGPGGHPGRTRDADADASHGRL